MWSDSFSGLLDVEVLLDLNRRVTPALVELRLKFHGMQDFGVAKLDSDNSGELFFAKGSTS